MKVLFLTLTVFLAPMTSAEELCYHDSNPAWIFNAGICRGTWFDVGDFYPGAGDFTVEWVEAWISAAESQVFVELWNGGLSGPAELLGSEELIGNTVCFDPPVNTDEHFWCLLTSSEDVQVLADGDSDSHSLYTDDFLIWESFDGGEFFISAGNETQTLSGVTWAEMKNMFKEELK